MYESTSLRVITQQPYCFSDYFPGHPGLANSLWFSVSSHAYPDRRGRHYLYPHGTLHCTTPTYINHCPKGCLKHIFLQAGCPYLSPNWPTNSIQAPKAKSSC